MRKCVAIFAAVLALIGLTMSAAFAAPTKPLSPPHGGPLVHHGPGVYCGSGARVLVRGAGVPLFIRNAHIGGRGPACVRTNGQPSFRIRSVPKAGGDVVSFDDLTYGCHWQYCTPGTVLPLRVSKIRSMHSSVRTAGAPWGTYNRSYDVWFNRRYNPKALHPNGAELMIWNGTHGGCCGLASNATRVRIDDKWWIRTHWVMHDRSDGLRYNGVRWNYIQYRLVHPRRAMHVNVADFMRDAERIGQIRRSWFMQCAEYGFEEWFGGPGLRVVNYHMHIRRS